MFMVISDKTISNIDSRHLYCMLYLLEKEMMQTYPIVWIIAVVVVVVIVCGVGLALLFYRQRTGINRHFF